MKTKHHVLSLLLSLMLTCLSAACSGPQVPRQYQQGRVVPRIYPDYVGVTVPVNIAPLNFELLTGGDDAVVRFSASGKEILCEGLKARPDVDKWHALLAAAAGKAITVETYVLQTGQWTRFMPFEIYVSGDSIDPWLSYRLISPSYVSYEELTLNQRCLETFEERVFADNMLCSTQAGGQCINCHSYQQWNPRRMQLHARQTYGGTLIAYDGQVEKVSLQHDSLLSAAVYPAWHPQLKLIAYSTNKTMQAFHTAHRNKIEVYDAESDLVLYDVDRHEVRTIENRPDELETFPCWSPDGRWLYYCSAHFEYRASHADAEEITLRATELRYSIYRKPFDPQTRHFGERQLVVEADSLFTTSADAHYDVRQGGSAALPRISPDGRWLLFTVGQWGNFHIWHHDADLWLMDLERADSLQLMACSLSDMARPLDGANSDDTESYHSWSSNGRWVVFSSRRYDGVFTRPFFVHVDSNGRASKPFELPAADPDYHRQLMKSYNVPELTKGPVDMTPQEVADQLKQEGRSVAYQ